MGILLCFHLQILIPLFGSQPSLTRTITAYLTGSQKWPQPGQTAREKTEGNSFGRILVFLHIQGHAEDPCMLDAEVTSRRCFRGFIWRTWLMEGFAPAKVFSTIMKVWVICFKACCVRTVLLHGLGRGDAKTCKRSVPNKIGKIGTVCEEIFGRKCLFIDNIFK